MVKSLFHWKVFVNLLLAVGVFTGLIWLTFRWLEFHTNHGKEIAVPNVMNISVHKAIETLDDSGLAYEVDSFNYDPKYKPFQVLQIYPSAGSKVKDGRTIILKVNPKTWAPIALPDVLDRYKFTAFRQLDRLGIKVADTLYEPSIQKDAIIKMMYNGAVVKPGFKIPKFSSIDVVIGSGPKRNVIVPNLVGRTVAEAKAIISQNYFEVGLIEYEDSGNNDTDIVYYQDPEGGSVRDQGMQVDLWASKKSPAEMQSKIQELNEVYRVEMVIPAEDPSSDYQVPEYTEPVQSSAPAPISKPKITVSKPTVDKPKSSSSTTETPAKPAENKPKAKEVIIE